MHNSARKILFFSVLLLGGFLISSEAAKAQATRTWVSGVGDDANPCSRTAPCKTFAGAISKTAAGGEINCLDPGGFGAVTITKAITISCPYTEGGVLAAGNGIIVNAGAADVVVLRGLDIFGVPTQSNGIRFLAGAALHVEDSVIRRFSATNSLGIIFQPSGASRLYVSNTRITDNGSGTTGGGIQIQPTGTGSAQVTLQRVQLHNNANNAFRIDTTGNSGAGITVSIENSAFTGSAQGIAIVTPAGTASVGVMLSNSVVANNSGFGLITNGAGATLRVANTTITGNATGVNAAGGSSILSYGNNRLDGNPTVGAPNNGSFTGAVIPTR